MAMIIHQFLCVYLTIPVTSATSERTFYALERVITSIMSTMTEMRLNNCLLLHIHKELSDTLDLVSVETFLYK